MSKRALVSVGVTLVTVIAVVAAVLSARSLDNELFFDSLWWLVLAAPLAGITLAGLTRRVDPHVQGDKVLRHDGAAMLEHWTHGIGTMFLLITGIMLGFWFVPRLASSGPWVWATMNVHFVFVLLFLFGTFYYATNTFFAPQRFKEHLPTKNAITFTVQHYGHLLGIKRFHMPPEDKYYESEKMAYLMALAGSIAIIVSGLFKALAHVIDIAPAVMDVMTWTHDIATVLMLLFFLAHVFFAAIAPFSWPVLGSMFTGYVSKKQAQTEHAGWFSRIPGGGSSDTGKDL